MNPFISLMAEKKEQHGLSNRMLGDASGYSKERISMIFRNPDEYQKLPSDLVISVSRGLLINPINGLVMAGIISSKELQEACEEVEQ